VTLHAAEARPRTRLLGPVVVALSTAIVILALAVGLLVQPLFTHWALSQARSAEWLGLSPAETEQISDRTIGELVFGPGTFAFPIAEGGPRFYDPAEAAHLADARLLFLLLIGAGVMAAVIVAGAVTRARGEVWPWRAISRGGLVLAVGLVVVGAGFLVAFDYAFELFHRLFFPGGNWEFDPTTQWIVRLYPVAFWQLAVGALGVLGIAGGLAAWWVGRARTRHLERPGR
jgi:integral membrane protein (TIGR01906 family)